jgi:NDP-sugar pyrophosphorylase family protein
MKAVIAAAGCGSRMGTLTADRPKGLIPINGTPLLEHVLKSVVEIDPTEIIIVTGYEGAAIQQRIGTEYKDYDVCYVTQEPRRGLADAFRQAAPRIDQSFLALNCDTLFSDSLEPLIDAAADADGCVSVVPVPKQEASECGVCLHDCDRLQDIVDAPSDPPSTDILAGAYVFPPAIFDIINDTEPSSGEFRIADAIEALLNTGYRIAVHPFVGEWINVNAPPDIRYAESHFPENR